MAASKRVYDSEDPPEAVLELYVCTDHDKHQIQAKVAAVVMAFSAVQAEKLLDAALVRAGLRPKAMWRYRIQKLSMDRAFAEILNDGDY